jgi:chorismate-pyruvate lyase
MLPASRIRLRPDRILLVLLLCSPLAGADDAPAARSWHWPDSFVARLEALALVQTLNADLLSHDSATQTLERWCADHRLAAPATVVAARVAGADTPATDEQRRELGVGADEPVRYRRVKLMCGQLVLSEADNWYVPSRLTADMNRLLDTTDTPFGRAVQALHFHRHTLSATLLWQPLAAGWEMNPDAAAPGTGATTGAGELIAPPGVLQHRALLSLPDGTPVSEVVETYSSNVLAFAPPRR